ncbi:MAG: LD-carboxypeptidase, partial [Clostridia bacterium]
LRGSEFLTQNPKARADDIMWAFENQNVKAIIANVGGNDSIKVISHIDTKCIINNPKILIGYSDVMNLNILCYKCGLSSFYGDNVLSPIAEAQGWHKYSKKWFKKVLFDNSIIGEIKPSNDWTFDPPNDTDKTYYRNYRPNVGYELIQGNGKVQGRLFGGHTGIMELKQTTLSVSADDFDDVILFVEDIPEFFTPHLIGVFLNRLNRLGALQKIKGIIIGKANENISFDKYKIKIIDILTRKLGLVDLPVIYGLNFGHTSPVCVLPYGAMAEINCENTSFSILESGVL